MKFVTSAYKKKLMEQKKWELQQQLEDEREQRNDVTKTGMSGYVVLLLERIHPPRPAPSNPFPSWFSAACLSARATVENVLE